MTKWPTEEQKKRAIEIAQKRTLYLPVSQVLCFEIEDIISDQMMIFQKEMKILKIPAIHCEMTQVGEKLNSNMQWVPVYDYTSVTVKFIDPDTLRCL